MYIYYYYIYYYTAYNIKAFVFYNIFLDAPFFFTLLQ